MTKSAKTRSQLVRTLLGEFYSFSFFQAVHLVERLRPDKEKLGLALRPADEPLRFTATPGFRFPAGEISGLKQSVDGSPAEMAVTFMGLTGPCGVLPDWYHELVMARAREKDHSMAAFYDLFHHRLISLFYLAWKKHRVTANQGFDGNDAFSSYLMSLIGLGGRNPVQQPEPAPELPLFCSGLLARRVPSATTVTKTVQHLFGVPVELEQFLPRLLALDPEDASILGERNCRLGVDTVCGAEVCETQTRFRLSLGPLSYREFTGFLPTGNKLRRLLALVRYIVGLEYQFEVRLVLKKEEVPCCRLGERDRESPRLGWSTWIAAAGTSDRGVPFVTFQEADLDALYAR